MKQHNPQETVEWLRETAKQLNDLADDLEEKLQTIQGFGAMASRLSDKQPSAVTVPAIRQLMIGQNARPATIAKKLGARKSDVIALMTKENGFELFGKGWYRTMDNGGK